ncbi:MAG: toxin-antitoxin system YwqK family antitoxin [Clostridia bacterium]|nr:toxin-antitoxin system YwqK family antitoxin [Clostridia bacterium]
MKKVFSVVLLAVMIISISSGCVFSQVPISENLINQIQGGYLYTSMYKGNSEETAFHKERIKAIGTLIDSIKKTAAYSFDVSKGLISYENNLLSYIDKIDDNGVSSSVKELTDQMFAYKIIIDSKKNEVKAYLGMKPKEAAVKSAINTYLLHSVCELVTMQKDYLEWLMLNTAATATLLQPTSSRQAGKVISSSESTYKNRIKTSLNKMLFEYEKAAMMNSYIISADYYASGYFLSEAKTTIDNLKNQKQSDQVNDELSMIEAILKEVSTGMVPPATLKNPPKSSETNLLFRTVEAADNEVSFLGTGVSTLDAVSLTDDEKYDKNENYGVPESVEQPSSAPDSAEVSEMSNPVKLTIDNSKLNQLVIFGAQTEISSLNWTISSQYAEIVKLLADRISNIKKDISDEQKENIRNLIENELTSLLGGKKDEFVDRFLNSSASELIEIYNNWIVNGSHAEDMNFDKDDLISLLNAMGIDIKEDNLSEEVVNNPSPTKSVLPASALSPSPSVISTPVPSEEVFIGDMTHIVASYELLKSISPSESNEKILEMVFGWIDTLDYSSLRKEESRDSSGNISNITYYDDSGKAGWKLTVMGNTLEYNYYVSGNSSPVITIYRKGTYESSVFYSFVSIDEESKRRSYLRYDYLSESDTVPVLDYAGSTENNLSDGLMVDVHSETSSVDVTYFTLGKVLDSYKYRNDILTEETHNEYVGENVVSEIMTYYDDGSIHFIFHKRNGKSDGIQISYYENGNTSYRIEYREGVFHGKSETYYESGNLKELTTYEDGMKNGEIIKKYENGQIDLSGAYRNDKADGVWLRFLEDGTPVSEIGYKEGVTDGIYHLYATGSQTYNSIHTIGQYSEGKKTGIWYYGYNNEGYVEKYLYENDVKIWQEAGNTRTYYNPDGSVKSTEKIS